jgi:hypothetical protein
LIFGRIFDSSEESLQSQTQVVGLFKERIDDLRNSVIQIMIKKLMFTLNIDVDKELAKLAVKIGITFDIHKTGSVLINHFTALWEKCIEKNNDWNITQQYLNIAFLSLTKNSLQKGYGDQILLTESKGDKEDKKTGKKLTEVLEEQKAIDLEMLGKLM